jgi:preprotein translocase subunit SecE
MAVAEARKMDKQETESTGSPSPLPPWLSWGPNKLKELKAFFIEVRSELKKVTWPDRNEVKTTTVVVIVTTVIFGFYLYGLDLLLSQVFTRILR